MTLGTPLCTGCASPHFGCASSARLVLTGPVIGFLIVPTATGLVERTRNIPVHNRQGRVKLASEVFSRQHRRARVLFALSDAAIASLAFVAAYQTRLLLPLERIFYILLPVKALVLGFAIVVWIGLGVWLKVYERLESADPLVILRDTSRQCAAGTVCLVLFGYLLRLDLSRLFLAFFAVYCWAALLLFRLTAGRLVPIFRKELAARRYVMVVGLGVRARKLGAVLEEGAGHGIRLLGFLSDGSGEELLRVELKSDYPVYGLEQLPRLLEKHVIDEIIFAVASERLAELEEVFLLCDEEGVRTRVAVDFFPHANSEVYLERFGQTPLLTFSAAPHDEIRLLVKRITDVVLSAAALIVLLPFMAIVALLIRLSSPGPAIFRQQRCGLNGRRFTFYKFRSMVENAESLKASLQHLSERETAFKITGDPRLTAVGRFLRKFSIDEWPQLWNVLKGDMSLVGPRPPVPQEVALYKRWQRRRLRMRPGLTCLWTLAGRDAVDFETWMRLDMEYIDNWSLGLDWKIILRTIPSVIIGRGAS